MPPYRGGRKQYRCIGYAEEAAAAAKLKKAATPRQPKKVLTQEEKDAAALEKEERKKIRKAKETWEATLVPWVADNAFRFPLKTMVSRISTRLSSKPSLTRTLQALYKSDGEQNA